MVELLAALYAVGDLARPRVGRRLERVERLHELAALLLLLPLLGREGLDVLNDLVELDVRDVPREHRGAVEAAAHDPEEVLVVRQLVARTQARELEYALREVARRRAQPVRRRAVAIALLAVAGVAVEHVRLVAVVQVVGADLDVPGERSALLERVRFGGAAGRHAREPERRRRSDDRPQDSILREE